MTMTRQNDVMTIIINLYSIIQIDILQGMAIFIIAPPL